jgi:hypothetical protein
MSRSYHSSKPCSWCHPRPMVLDRKHTYGALLPMQKKPRGLLAHLVAALKGRAAA